MSEKSDADFIAECEALLTEESGAGKQPFADPYMLPLIRGKIVGRMGEAIQRLKRAASWEAVAAGYCEQLSEKVKETASLKRLLYLSSTESEIGRECLEEWPQIKAIIDEYESELLKEIGK